MIAKRILITGASGFIGRALVRHFVNKGSAVFGVDRHGVSGGLPLAAHNYRQINLPGPDLKSLLIEWMPDTVIHCAGKASVPDAMHNPRLDFIDGPVLTFELLNALKENSPSCAFLFLSSAAVYGNPTNLPVKEDKLPKPLSTYGYHKWQSELLCKEFSSIYGLQTASARIFSAYGIGLRRQVIWDITRKILADSEVVLQGTGLESRDFIHDDDIVDGLNTILEHSPLCGDVYNLASGTETRIVDLCSMIQSFIGPPRNISFSGEIPDGTPKNWRADISLLSSLGFYPKKTLRTGLKLFVDWVTKEMDKKNSSGVQLNEEN